MNVNTLPRLYMEPGLDAGILDDSLTSRKKIIKAIVAGIAIGIAG